MSMFKALTMYPVWDKWLMPRCDVIPPPFYEDPEKWSLSNIDDIRGPRASPPIGPVRCEYILLDRLSHEQGNLFRICRWDDFRKEEPIPMDYEPVKDFDSRFFYYDSYSIIAQSLLHNHLLSNSPPLVLVHHRNSHKLKQLNALRVFSRKHQC